MAEPAIFTRLDDDRYLPTEYARGPWDPRATHGGAPSALFAGVLERVLAGADADGTSLHPARLTIDLERPVGLVPLTVRASIVRPGRKVRIAEAELCTDDGTRVARATLLGIRLLTDALDQSAAVLAPGGSPPPRPAEPQAQPPAVFAQDVEGPMFHADAVEHRFTTGSLGVPGPAIDWIRLRVRVVDGEPTTPLQRVAAAADFGNGVSGAFPPGWSFINPDLTITLHRLPAGEWVCLDARTHLGTHGVGSAESELWDDEGRLGRSIQNLVIEQVG